MLKNISLPNFKNIAAASLVAVYALVLPGVASAQYSQYNLYVGGPAVVSARQISVNKMVQNPQTGSFVDNISASNFNFLNNQQVTYRIEVRNSGASELNNIAVKDQFPAELNFVSGPGSFDPNTRALSLNITNLGAGQAYVFDFKASVTASTNKGGEAVSSCPTNKVEVRVNELFAADQSTICVGPQILGAVEELPVTGPAQTLMILVGSAISLGLSTALFKFSSRKSA